MASLIDLIPEGNVKKLGKALFEDHKDKIKAIIEASDATEAELRDPKKLAEWFGTPGEDVGKKPVSIPMAKTKLKITVTFVDYKKVRKALEKGNAWYKKVAAFDPKGGLETRRKAVWPYVLKFDKSVIDNGQHQELTLARAEEAVPHVRDFALELNQMLGWLGACKVVFPKYKKIYATYADIFQDAETVFEKLLTTIPLPPNVQAELLAHYLACMKLRSECQTAKRHCAAITRMAKKQHTEVRGYQLLAQSWTRRLGKTLTPAVLKDAKEAVEEAVAPYFAPFKKVFGAV